MSSAADERHATLDELSAYLDRQLSERRRGRLEAHLAGCVDCQGQLDAMRGVVRGLKSLERVEPPPTLDLWVSRRIDLEGRRQSLMERLESQLRGPRRQSFVLPFLALTIFFAVILYLFSNALEREGKRPTQVVLTDDGVAVIDNRRPEDVAPRELAGRRLVWTAAGRWVEDGVDAAAARRLALDSPDGQRLLAEHPELAEVAALGDPVVIALAGEVLELRPAPSP